FYDPLLNSHFGFTATTSKIFDSTGKMVTGVSTLVSLDTATLQTEANTLGVPVLGVSYGIASILPTVGASVSPSGGTDPATPRPVHIQFELLTTASDVKVWEAN